MNDLPDDGEGFNGRMLEQRVARLEEDMRDVKSVLRSIDSRLGGIEVALAELKGRLGGIETRISQSPTWLQLLVALIATWGAGAAIVAGVVRFLAK